MATTVGGVPQGKPGKGKPPGRVMRPQGKQPTAAPPPPPPPQPQHQPAGKTSEGEGEDYEGEPASAEWTLAYQSLMWHAKLVQHATGGSAEEMMDVLRSVADNYDSEEE